MLAAQAVRRAYYNLRRVVEIGAAFDQALPLWAVVDHLVNAPARRALKPYRAKRSQLFAVLPEQRQAHILRLVGAKHTFDVLRVNPYDVFYAFCPNLVLNQIRAKLEGWYPTGGGLSKLWTLRAHTPKWRRQQPRLCSDGDGAENHHV